LLLLIFWSFLKAVKNRELEAQRARQMEDALAALQDQLQKARIVSGDQVTLCAFNLYEKIRLKAASILLLRHT
jgi:hypothetical protein